MRALRGEKERKEEEKKKEEGRREEEENPGLEIICVWIMFGGLEISYSCMEFMFGTLLLFGTLRFVG